MQRRRSRTGIFVMHRGVGVALVAIALTACKRGADQPVQLPQLATPANEVVARVGEREIHADVVRRAMIRHGGAFGDPFDTLDEKEELVRELVRTEALAALAVERGYDRDPEIQETITRVLADRYRRDLLRENPPPAITDEDVRAYYDEHADEFATPERARLSVVEIRIPGAASDDERDRLRKRAEEVRAEAVARASEKGAFREISRRESNDPKVRARAGDLGWLVEGVEVPGIDPRVSEAAFALPETGAISPVIETDKAFVIVRRTDSVPAGSKSFADAAPEIRQKLSAAMGEAHYASVLDEVAGQFDVEIDRDVLSRVGPQPQVAGSRSLPPSFPVGAEVKP